MKIIIFGPQGSGKGTQAHILSEELSIPHITMGDLLRTEAKSGSDLGQKINAIINEGKLAPDEIAFSLISERINMQDCSNGCILDGFPRSIEQAHLLNGIFKAEAAFEIWISDEEAILRIGGRRTCSNCGTVYHLLYNPPALDGKCGKCGAELIIRDDDKEDVIKKRLEIYHAQTEPLIKYFNEQGIYLKINGMPPIPEVTREIFEKLKY